MHGHLNVRIYQCTVVPKTIYHMEWTLHPPYPQFHIFNLLQENKKKSTERRAPVSITASFWEHELGPSGFDLRELGCSQVSSLGWPLTAQRSGVASVLQLSGIRNHNAFLRPDMQYAMFDPRVLQLVGRCPAGLPLHCILPTQGSLSKRKVLNITVISVIKSISRMVFGTYTICLLRRVDCK